jgi:hypothetical protein
LKKTPAFFALQLCEPLSNLIQRHRHRLHQQAFYSNQQKEHKMSHLLQHPLMHLSEIRPTDIWLLLSLGTLYEVASRWYLHFAKRKPMSLLEQEATLQVMQKETDRLRKMGPKAFVETSKMERQVLALEKKVSEIKAQRKARLEHLEKSIFRKANVILSLVVFILYFGVPMMRLKFDEEEEPLRLFEETTTLAATAATSNKQAALQSLLFPISYLGFGIKISRLGLVDPKNSIGALVVLWSSQVTWGKLFDVIDAYYIC